METFAKVVNSLKLLFSWQKMYILDVSQGSEKGSVLIAQTLLFYKKNLTQRESDEMYRYKYFCI